MLSDHSLSFISHWGCFNFVEILKHAYLAFIAWSKQDPRRKNAILLDQRLWKLKTFQLLLAYCLLEGPWVIIFFFFFFSGGYRGTPNSTAGHLSIFFCEVVEHLLLYISSKYLYFCIAHASNAIILRKSESFWIKNVLILGAW